MLAELIPNTNGSSLTFYRLDEQHIQYKRQWKKHPGPKAWKRIGVDTYLPTIGLIDINGDERSDCDNADNETTLNQAATTVVLTNKQSTATVIFELTCGPHCRSRPYEGLGVVILQHSATKITTTIKTGN